MPHNWLLQLALNRTCSRLPSELRTVPLEHWNESTFRFFIVRELLSHSGDTRCWSEWNRVDLVLPARSGATFVELKFFAHRQLRDISGRVVRTKGGPGLKNVREVEQAVRTLARTASKPWIRGCGGVAAAYLVLAYCDPAAPEGNRTYGAHYDALAPGRHIGAVKTIADRVRITDDTVFTCKLVSVRLEAAA